MEVQSRWGYSGIAIRKRVQHTSGEVLTEQVVLECLQVEHIERAQKKRGGKAKAKGKAVVKEGAIIKVGRQK